MSSKELVIFAENHTKQELEICLQQRLGTIHSLDIDKTAWLKEELQGRREPEVGKDNRETCQKMLIPCKNLTILQKNKFIPESFKIDENKLLNKDEKLKEEEVIKMLLDNFLGSGIT